MTVRDALNRGYNLVGTAIVAISGFAFSQEFFFEDEVTHKPDEGVLFLLAIGAIAWYFIGNNKFSRTIVPLLFTGAALIMKLLALFLLETGDSADLGHRSHYQSHPGLWHAVRHPRAGVRWSGVWPASAPAEHHRPGQQRRHRLQQVIDRRFYRYRYNAAQTLAAFSTTLRHEVDLDQLSEALLAVVEETMQPSHLSLWVRPTAPDR